MTRIIINSSSSSSTISNLIRFQNSLAQVQILYRLSLPHIATQYSLRYMALNDTTVQSMVHAFASTVEICMLCVYFSSKPLRMDPFLTSQSA